MHLLIAGHEVDLMCMMHQVPVNEYPSHSHSYKYTEMISYTVQCSQMERPDWQPALIMLDLRLVVSNMQPGCQDCGSLYVPFPACCLPIRKANQIHDEKRRGRVSQAARRKVLKELKSIK